jgi:hypothetical protein
MERVRRSHNGSNGERNYELSDRRVSAINSALSDDTDVSSKKSLRCNKIPKRCFQGKIPGYDGFMLDCRSLRDVGGVSDIVVPYLTGRELLNDFKIERWAIDFRNADMPSASKHASAFEYLRKNVLPAVESAVHDARQQKSDMLPARVEHLGRWWQFWNRRDELNARLENLTRYIGCSRVTRRPVMVFLSTRICPSDLVQVFALEDDYSFGVLQSTPHFEWFRKSSRLKVESDLRYSVRDVFETFPWPQHVKGPGVKAVADAARELRRIRKASIPPGEGLRSLYRLLDLPGRHPLRVAQADLDKAVLRAYEFCEDGELLGQLMELNQHLARMESDCLPIVGPGIPPGCEALAGELTSSDCYEP